jgi:type IV pilus assembly protein PilE
MKDKRRTNGFTIIELMIVVGVVAILVTLALPSYQDSIRKARRAEAEQLLLNWASLQEIWRANNPTYDDGTNISVPTHDDYTFTVSGTSSSTFTLTADPDTEQSKDKDRGQLCDPLTLNQSGNKSPVVSGVTYCWGN